MSFRRGITRRLRESFWSAVLLSVVLHLAAFVVLMRVVWQDRPAPSRLIIAEAWLGPPGGGAANAGATPALKPGDVPKPPVPAEENVAAVRGAAAVPDAELNKLIETIAAEKADALPLPADKTAPGAAGLSLGGGTVTAGGSGPGSGGGFGGVMAGGPESGFFGQRGNAYKIVYVIDTSGSLGWIFEPVQQALIDSIEKLIPSQSFHVIFAGATPVELPAKRLVPAISHYTTPAKKFIRELVPEMKCDPVAGMKRAFECKPELVYLLSDGDFGPQGAELLARLREWNADKNVHITAIGFGVKLKASQLGGVPVGEPILRQIAQEHGGNFRWISPDDAQEPTQ